MLKIINLRKSFALLATILTFILVILFSGMGGSETAATVFGGNVAPSKSFPSSFIIQGTDAETVGSLVQSYGGEVTSNLEIIQGVGAKLPSQAVASLLAEPAITSITPNGAVEVTGSGHGESGSIPQTNYSEVVGADVVWSEGITGEGLTIALVDTGIAPHSGLFKNTEGKPHRISGWVDYTDSHKKPIDPNGHGTHIAGIIANSQMGDDGTWNGVAPGVNLVGVRVLDENGKGNYEQAIQGIQWVVDHKDEYNIRVMNLSLIAKVQSPYWGDPLNQALMKAWAEGIVVVVAAGNGGPDAMSIGVPGNNPYVITVGAFTDNFTPNDWSDDYITPFSSAGPTLDGFVKPDVVAPGAHMVSTMLPSSTISRNHEANQKSSQYFAMAGTSQATGVISGIAALMLSRNPDLTPDQVKFRIMNTAFPWIDIDSTEALYSIWQQGAGRVNAPDAVFADIRGAANSGLDIWADLSGREHFAGFSVYDEETGTFHLLGEFEDWAGGYGTWAGGYGTWAGGYGTWAGGYGTWAGGYGTWAGGYGTWAGGYGTWAGGYGTWAGGYGTWAGGYGTWAGGYGTWAGGYGTWAGTYGDSAFAESFTNWSDTDIASSWAETQHYIGEWLEE